MSRSGKSGVFFDASCELPGSAGTDLRSRPSGSAPGERDDARSLSPAPGVPVTKCRRCRTPYSGGGTSRCASSLPVAAIGKAEEKR
jgi:hypothetical protein